MAIRVEIELDDGSFTTRMLHAGESVAQFQSQVRGTIASIDAFQRTSRGFLGTLRDVTIVLGMASAAVSTLRSVTTGWAADIVKVNAEFERLTSLLKGMSSAGDALKDAKEQVRQLRDIARTTPYSMQGLADVFTKLTAGGLDPLKGSMMSLVDAVASFGGSEEVLKRASLAIQQMSGKGVIQMEELRQQLGEAVPRAAELMARSMGVTYGELVKAISTGTVQSKDALLLLQGEMDRTFGGAAASQMNTFNGLMTQLTNAFQGLQLRAGESGFFDRVKQQAQTLIDLLNSRGADGLAQSVGRMLTSLISGFNSALNVVIRFHDEITTAGKALVVGFGAKIAIDALIALTGTLGTTRAAMTAFSLQWALMQRQWTAGVAVITATGSQQLGVLQSRMIAVRTGIAAVASTLAMAAPFLVVLGTAAAFAYAYLDPFKTKVKEARQELEQMGGAASKASLKLMVKDIQEQERQLDLLYRKRDYYNRIAGTGDKHYGAEITPREKKLAADRELVAKASAGYIANQAEDAADKSQRAFEEMLGSQTRLIDIYGKQMADAQTAALAKAAKEGKSTEALKAGYAKDERDRQLSIHDLRISLAENEYDELAKIYEKQEGVEREITERRMVKLLEFTGRQREQREALEKMPIGIPTLPKLIDEDKLYKKGAEALERMRDSIKGSRAELSGANADVAELYSALERGKFGPAGIEATQKVRELIDNLLQAQAEKSKLDDLIEGKSKFDRDGSNLTLSLQQQIFEEQTRSMSEVDKWKLKIQSGFYNGIGPGNTPLERMMVSVNDGLSAAKVATDNLAVALRKNLFGSETLDGGNTLVETLTRAADQVDRMKNGAAGVAAASAGITIRPGAVDMAGGASGSYLDRLIKQESSGNPNAKASTSSALGLGQFIETTWLAFLKDMHPEEVRDMTKAQALDLRRNSDLMKEAIVWYANQNAKVLANAGVQVNDATLYLAHFLGPQGAITALTKDLSTPLSSIRGLADALAANPFLRGKDVGWLKNWAEAKMGVGSTYRPSQKDDSQAPMPEGLSSEQRATVQRAEQLQQVLNQLKLDNAVTDKVKELSLELKRVTDTADGAGKKVTAVEKAIREGTFGSSETEKDPTSKRYERLIELAKKLDEEQARAVLNQKLRQRVMSASQSNETLGDDLDFREAEVKRRLAEESTFKLSESTMRLLANQARAKLAGEKLLAQGDASWSADQQRQLVETNAEIFQRTKDLEVANFIQAEQKKVREEERSLMTADQAREAAFQEEVKRLQDLSSQYSGNAEMRAQIEEVIQRKIRVSRAKTDASSPIAKQMREWSDIGNNMQKSMTGWLDSATDQLAEFVTTGKADFASLFQSIAKDITKMALKWALSGMFGGAGGMGKLGGAGKMAGMGGVGGGAKMGGMGGAAKMAGVAHTGAIVGQGFHASRSVNLSAFARAPRFHTGGIIGSDEVPIIAQRGEGVFTAEQMKAMGGAAGTRMVTIAPTIQVNATGGNPAENADLAAQTAKAAEKAIRSIVIDEMMTQNRPGNMLAG